jgi:hypothetical protein
MRIAIALLAVAVGGCFYVGKDQLEDILQQPVTQWSSRDCLTVMLSSMQNNLNDQHGANIQVIATPYTPAVIAAINRVSQTKGHWSDDETQHQIDTSLFLQAGLFFDWQTNQLMDSHGNYMGKSGRLDVLQFLVTLRNKSWPCNIPVQTVNHGTQHKPMFSLDPIAKPTDWPCYIPDITDLDQRIYLTNDRGLSVKPKYVFGRRNNQLTMEETLVVSFDLHSGDRYLFDESENISLALEGFDVPIKLTFPIAGILRMPVSPSKTTVQTQ